MHQAMNDSIASQLNMSIKAPNPYINYGGSPTMNIPFNQVRPLPKIHTNGIPYPTMDPYLAFSGIPQMYPSQYMGSYQPNSMCFGQTAPHALIGYDKTDLMTRNS